MRRHAKSNNVISLIIILELHRMMTFMIVKDQETLYIFCTTLSMLIEVFYSFDTQIIDCSFIMRQINHSIV